MLRRVAHCLQRTWRCDPALVALPESVQRCVVYRNVLTLEEEGRIYAELSRVLPREGEVLLLEGSTPERKIVKHTYLEMYGLDKDFAEVRSWRRREVRRLPGLTWMPTLLAIMAEAPTDVLGGQLPDTARVVEHNLPGYEMHTEHPTVGTRFAYVNLFADTVLEFDDEGSGRRGQVLLPARAVMAVSGEARWGFRFGEVAEEVHRFRDPRRPHGRPRELETDLRVGIQLWRLQPSLLDGRLLQEQLEEKLEIIQRQRAAQQQQKAKTADSADAGQVDALSPVPSPAAHAVHMAGDTAPAAVGEGPLGGDFARPQSGVRSSAKMSFGDIAEDYNKYKTQFRGIHGLMKDMKAQHDAGQPVNDFWYKKKLREISPDSVADEANGFDATDIEGTWDRADAKARFYKSKLRTMDYDGTAFLHSTMPDISNDAPLDMRTTIRKIAPLVKDGEKILSGLPGGDQL